MKHFIAPSVLALFATTAIAQAPNFSPPQPVPGALHMNFAAREQTSPAVCAGATSSLVVWEDSRSGELDLYGIRVQPSGALLDAAPFIISRAPGSQSRPKIAWNGQSWLVVFKNQVKSASGYFEYQFAGVRVSDAGIVLDAVPIGVGVDGSGGDYAVGSSGGDFAICYTGYSAGNSSIRAARIASGGVVLDQPGVEIQAGTYYVYGGLSVTGTTNQYLFSWGDAGMKVRRFTQTLQPVDPAPVTLVAASAGTGMPVITTNNTDYFLAWERSTPSFVQEIVGARFTSNLVHLNPSPILISGSTAQSISPQVTFDGTQYVVGWTGNLTSSLRAARVTVAGVVRDPGGVPIQTATTGVLYGTTMGALPAGGALFAWSDLRNSNGNGGSDLYGTPFTVAGASGTNACLVYAAELQRTPRIAAGDGQYLIIYRADTQLTTRILAQRVNALGNAIDSEPLVVVSGSGGSYSTGSAAWNGLYYLLTYSNPADGNIYGRRLSAQGQWLDAAGFPILAGSGSDVAALGNDFLVTALKSPGYPQTIVTYGARVRGTDGAVLDNPSLQLGGTYATRSRVVALGNRWAIATESHFTHDETGSNILVAFVDPAGVVTPAVSIGIAYVQQVWGIVDIASRGDEALVVWNSGSNWVNSRVFGRRILADGTIAGPTITMTATTLGQMRPAAVWTGNEYVVAFEDLRNNTWFYDYEPDVYGVRVSVAGVVADAEPFPLWNGEDYEVTVDGAGLGGGRAVFVASTLDGPPVNNYHMSTRLLRPDGLSNFGSGTPGCVGVIHTDASGAAKVGDPSFAILADRAPSGSQGLLLVTDAALPPGADQLGVGVLLHVDLLLSQEFIAFDIFSDPDGNGLAILGIPADSNLIGRNYFVQTLWLDGACPLPPFNLCSSNGLQVTVQN